MKIHKKIKPHHHFNIWIASLLLLGSSVLAYNSTMIARIQAQENNGPSAATKKFFGFNDDNGQGQQFTEPDVCKNNPVQQQMQQLQGQMQSLQSQQSQMNSQGQAPTPPSGQATPDQQQAYQQQLQAYQQQQQANQQKAQALQAQMQQLQQQMQQLQGQMQQGPTDDCKKAIIGQAVAQMEAVQVKMTQNNRLSGTLDRVDAEIAKISADIPQLKAAGVSAADISAIQSDVSTIKQDNSILRAFFAKMLNGLASFITSTKADPLGAFDKMQKGQGFMNQQDGTTAANTADGMVNAFTNLVNLLDKVTGSQGGQ